MESKIIFGIYVKVFFFIANNLPEKAVIKTKQTQTSVNIIFFTFDVLVSLHPHFIIAF
jgi:hypothetical protein